jgi:5,10-methylenetetrahydromethanopterin reductase
MGIGTGNTARRTLGMPAAKLSELREHVDICRGLLGGQTVPYEEAGRRRMIRFLNPTGGWINLKKKVPIFVAASGPKTLELAGEIGDGVILFGAVGDSLLEYALSHVRRGAESAGKGLQDLYICVLTAVRMGSRMPRLPRPRVSLPVNDTWGRFGFDSFPPHVMIGS